MNTLKHLLAMTTLLTLFGVASTKAQETDSVKIDSLATAPIENTIKPESTKYTLIDNSFTNKNMFFGMNFGNIPLNQTYLETGNKDVTASVWTNYDLNQTQLIEIDLAVAYKKELDLGEKYTLATQIGGMYIVFPNSTWTDHKELNFKATLTGLPVDVSISAGKIFGESFSNTDFSDGSRVNLNLTKTVEISDKISATGNLETIYNSNYFSGAKGISHVGFTATATYSPLENLSINASLTGQQKVDADLEPVNTEMYFKGGVTYTFK
ncbi:MAG: hypothetical protein ACP5N2_04800 [Candidatus Nanoarchaeia archaeon]